MLNDLFLMDRWSHKLKALPQPVPRSIGSKPGEWPGSRQLLARCGHESPQGDRPLAEKRRFWPEGSSRYGDRWRLLFASGLHQDAYWPGPSVQLRYQRCTRYVVLATVFVQELQANV